MIESDIDYFLSIRLYMILLLINKKHGVIFFISYIYTLFFKKNGNDVNYNRDYDDGNSNDNFTSGGGKNPGDNNDK